MLHYCIACQYGDHDSHYEVIQAVPDGMIGGARCPCNGECRERATEIAVEYAEPLDLTEFAAFMDRFSDA